MKNTWTNYWIDMGMAAAGTACFITGIVKWPGLITSLGLRYSNLPMEAISAVHDWTGLMIVVLAAAHVLLHARWLTVMTKALVNKGGTKDE